MLGDLLGRGGMAEVFAGYSVGDHGFQKPVAIKRLLPELANDEVFVDRLIEEAKLLVGMQHGNIVSVLDLAREGDDVFLVMEFVDGPSLRQLIKARGSRGLSLGSTTYIMQSAAAGLEFAHVRPGGAIIHADISPSNLLLTTSGEVRVADFGIARREGLGHGVVEGKWAYMAPEQARGEPLSPRSDVFALGVVMYELLTGQHPFGRAVTASERDDQMRVIPPRMVKPSVPHGLEAICMRALAHDARDRYGRMQQLIDALVEERFTNGYREGASDLAQAIREVAPKSDGSAPRTMHTERPVTIVTRSLLRDMTPPRRPSYPLGPLDPPPRDEFPMQPTAAHTSARAIELSPSLEFACPPEPPPDPMTSALTMDAALPSLYPMIPTSGAQTLAREVDQVALAAAANAAAAILQLPSILRADGAPMPPFRMAEAVVPGGELSSVVGGHTLSGHSAAVAIESPRGHRWTIVVLAAAALIGVIAALAIQLTPAAREPAAAQPLQAKAAEPPAPTATPIDQVPARAAEPVEQPQVAPAEPPAFQPTFPDEPERPAITPARGPLDPAPPMPPPGAEPVEPAPAAAAAERGSDPRPGDTRPSPRKGSTSRDTGKRKVEPGILLAEASPWAWVSIPNQPNQKKRETPARFYLAPGTHVVRFYNPDNGVTKYERVTLESGKLMKIDEPMEQ